VFAAAHRPLKTVHNVHNLQEAQAVFALWQQLAATHGVVLRKTPPEPTTCCGRGCNGCVWEGWFDAVMFWQEDAQAAINAALPSQPSSNP
jgi:Oxidoreductase-like protein, N-terminal